VRSFASMPKRREGGLIVFGEFGKEKIPLAAGRVKGKETAKKLGAIMVAGSEKTTNKKKKKQQPREGGRFKEMQGKSSPFPQGTSEKPASMSSVGKWRDVIQKED